MTLSLSVHSQLAVVVIMFSLFIHAYLRFFRLRYGVLSRGAYFKRFRWWMVSSLRVERLPVYLSQNNSTVGGVIVLDHSLNTYPFQHLLSMWHDVDSVSYELSVSKRSVAILFHVFGKGLSPAEAFKDLKKKIFSVKSGLEARFPGIVISFPEPRDFNEIFRLYKGKVVRTEGKSVRVKLPDGEKCICVLKLSGDVEASVYRGMTQIDALLRNLIQLGVNARFIVSFRPVKGFFKHLKRKIERKKENSPLESELGLWEVSSYVVLEVENNDESDIRILQVKNIFSTIFSGSRSKLEIKTLSGRKIRKSIVNIALKRSIGGSFELSSPKLSVLTHLPMKSTPGLLFEVKPDFKVPPEDIFKRKQGVVVGKVTYGKRKIFPCVIRLSDIRKGVAVLGAIGSGKTRMVMKIVRDAVARYNIPVLVFESKGEFASLIRDLPPAFLEKLMVLRPGSTYAPLKINLFEPGEMDPEEYAKRLLGLLNTIFKSLFREDSELTIQMSKVLGEVLTETVKREETRSFNGFVDALKEYAKRGSHIPNILSTINALEARMNVLRRGMLGEVFNVERSNLDVEDLLQKVVIVDFSYLLSNGGTKEDAQIIMNLLTLHVFQAGLKRMNINTLTHLVVVDDARLLIPEVFTRRSTSDTTAVEDMITIERGKGQGLILVCQDPSVSRIALANCNTKIAFRLTFKSQSEEEFIRMSLNIPEDQREYLLTQPNRSAVVKLPDFPYPFPIITEEYKAIQVSPVEVEQHNRRYHPYLFNRGRIELEGQEINELLSWIASKGAVTVNQIAAKLKIKIKEAEELVKSMREKGYVEQTEETVHIVTA